MKHAALKGIIVSKGIKLGDVAKALGISRTNLSNKLKGIYEFKASEIFKIAEMLELPNREILELFF